MIVARDLTPKVIQSARDMPVVTITGPRQSGKTTLCRATFPEHPYVSLETPDVRSLAREDPRTFLARYPRGAILDEIQRVPDLLSYLQVAVDENPEPGQWILTGSHNLSLLESVGQSLAGRTAVLHLLPLGRGEVLRFDNAPQQLDETLLTGGYPRVLDRGLDPSDWHGWYTATYLERDVRTIGNVGDLSMFHRFMQLCAGRTAQLLNYSALAGDCGISQPTAKAWLGVLETGFLTFRLPAFHSNLRKRLVKMPKLHFYDTGLVCCLLGVTDTDQLASHPLRGHIFETWVASEIVKARTNRRAGGALSFYRDRGGAEVDIVIGGPHRLSLVETKSAATPASALLRPARRVRDQLEGVDCTVYCVYGGDDPQRRHGDTLLPWSRLHETDLEPAREGARPADA